MLKAFVFNLVQFIRYRTADFYVQYVQCCRNKVMEMIFIYARRYMYKTVTATCVLYTLLRVFLYIYYIFYTNLLAVHRDSVAGLPCLPQYQPGEGVHLIACAAGMHK